MTASAAAPPAGEHPASGASAAPGADRAAPPAYWHYDHFTFPLPERHRYPAAKYRLVRERLTAEGTLPPERLHRAEPAPWEVLELVHEPDYLEAVRGLTLTRAAERELGLPLSAELVARARAAVGATLAATGAALAGGAGGNLGGGNHHAFPGRASGYCLFNDIAVAARHAQREVGVERIAIVDLDVHQGNANGDIFARDRGVFTCSAHGERNWPHRKTESDVDIPLPDGSGDEAYLAAIGAPLRKLFAEFRPELVFYQAGVDPLACDRLGRLALTIEGLQHRDRLVLELCGEFACPVVVTMGGGYGEPLDATVEAHANTFRAVEEVLGAGTAARAAASDS